MPASGEAHVYNVNVGVLGHVDCGKTSLSKALSTTGSTAAFDKSPQSQQRGITLDLGFSAFYADAPEGWAEQYGVDLMQYTLVDCPGHASLIKTIIGGAQIIDMMILVIDVNKGIQTQTAECIVIAEMLARHLTIVLNKCDLIADDKAKHLEKVKKKLSAVFAGTRFKSPRFVCTSAAPGSDSSKEPEGLAELKEALRQSAPPPQPAKEDEKAFLMYVDHCFGIEGQGTILTGTILAGALSVGQTVHFPVMKIERKVRSIQVFKKPVKSARKGDRVGVSVSKLEAASLERGIVCASGANVDTYACGVARVEKVRFYKPAIPSNAKLHLTVGHSTVMGTVKFFSAVVPVADAPAGLLDATAAAQFSLGASYQHLDELPCAEDLAMLAKHPSQLGKVRVFYALIQFDQPLTTPKGATLIGSKLDTDVHANVCRLCFQGVMQAALKPEDLPSILAMKDKVRPITIDRVLDDYGVVGKNLVSAKGGDVTRFIGMKVLFEPPRDPETGAFSEGQVPFLGTVDSSFGKSGKVKILFKDPVFKKTAKGPACPKYKIYLRYRVNHYDKTKAMVQGYLPSICNADAAYLATAKS
ncbi:Selenocysteine-specific elongation factor [Diplonema papillatum]|nr:Selenocysteine-specific elongation factor [Diplonema papillatum]